MVSIELNIAKALSLSSVIITKCVGQYLPKLENFGRIYAYLRIVRN